MLTVNKPIAFSLLVAVTMMAGLPAHAGYYKTIYVDEPQPATTIIVNQPVQERVVVQEKYIDTSVDSSNAAIAALGIGALVGGVILGVASHNHHKKSHIKHSPKSQKHSFNPKHKRPKKHR